MMVSDTNRSGKLFFLLCSVRNHFLHQKGLTQFGNGSPFKPATIFSAANLLMALLASTVAEPICGNIHALGISNKGLPGCIGSGLVTSSPAPQIICCCNASVKSVSL